MLLSVQRIRQLQTESWLPLEVKGAISDTECLAAINRAGRDAAVLFLLRILFSPSMPSSLSAFKSGQFHNPSLPYLPPQFGIVGG
ncbi:uncharacterized [Tachysurus ichikawai]